MAIVELSNIRRVYKTGAVAVEALRGIDLSIEKGEFVSIMGSSGSGKSTLMNILGCLDKPTDGTYLLDGRDVSTYAKSDLAKLRNQTLGFVFQAFHLLPRTSALENVELPLLYKEDELSWKEIHNRSKKALESVGLGDRLDHTPNELSGGQKQRVAIARALVTEPNILLADEPTGNLDSRTSLEIINTMQRLNKEGLTILMVTHEPDIAKFTRRIVTLRDGVILNDRPNEPSDAATAIENWQDEKEIETITEQMS
ncbi:ABC transporter ATP-binding protein [Rhodohalobacter sp. SW132]|uniref:ABC transporter ATP-binding protein n=1 Tax=Rhodohalobacter sp. SW132 TaxID=2293433 RepID=UPI000E2550D5|nr:ABC transporter ATP-binding protein [Rhodohalobacter sp. SW132]REL37794.1 ABC transporter ATP-binding protein [Rhodohalobacter sp. SW132]